MTKVVSGKEIANKISAQLLEEIKRNKLNFFLAVILIGKNPASLNYIKIKEKKAKELGIDFKLYKFDKGVEERKVIELIKNLNQDDKVNGIIIQFPIPEHLDKPKIVNSILPKKDVDGLTSNNLGKLMWEEKGLYPATPQGVMKILDSLNINLAGKNIVVLGRSELVGLPLSVLLIKKQATVIVCNSKTKNLKDFTKKADVLISAVGKLGLVTKDMVKKGVIVIDVGTNKTKKGVVGDVNFDEVKDKVSFITPVPGGVGPLTVIMLYNNLVKAALMTKKAKMTDFKRDKEIFDLIKEEKQRQQDKIDLIPSENYASEEVMAALGTVLGNKYSEGYLEKRYYEGQNNIDQIEKIATERAKKLFGAEHANVQPYSGSPANQAVYFALLKLGDKVMGQALPSGGHLTHGWHVNFSGINYKSHCYNVDQKTCLLDYEEIREIAKKERPKMIIAGITAYPRIIDFKKFGEIAKEIDAYFLADISHISGLIVAGVHPSPFPYADVVTTTTHKTLRGPRGAIIMCKKKLAERIDKAVFPGLQGGPHDHQTAAIAVCLKEASTKEFKEYGKQIVKNAKKLASELIKKGYRLVTGGTDNHLMLIDLCDIKKDGASISESLEKAGITTNKNAIPNDPNPPARPCGIRIGTPACTTRGMKEKEMVKIAEWIDKVIKNSSNEKIFDDIAKEIKDFCKDFPIPGYK